MLVKKFFFTEVFETKEVYFTSADVMFTRKKLKKELSGANTIKRQQDYMNFRHCAEPTEIHFFKFRQKRSIPQ